MKWIVEEIGPHSNILICDQTKPEIDWEPVGIGFPNELAHRIVSIHNNFVDDSEERLHDAITTLKFYSGLSDDSYKTTVISCDSNGEFNTIDNGERAQKILDKITKPATSPVGSQNE